MLIGTIVGASLTLALLSSVLIVAVFASTGGKSDSASQLTTGLIGAISILSNRANDRGTNQVRSKTVLSFLGPHRSCVSLRVLRLPTTAGTPHPCRGAIQLNFEKLKARILKKYLLRTRASIAKYRLLSFFIIVGCIDDKHRRVNCMCLEETDSCLSFLVGCIILCVSS